MMADWQHAVQPAPEGVRLLVEVAAGARENRFPDAFNPWRDGRIGIRVRAAAQEGRANGEVIATVAALFGLPAARVEITAGEMDHRKTIVLHGVTKAQVLPVLQPYMERRAKR